MFKFGSIASMMGGLQKLPEAMAEMTEQLRAETFGVSAGDGAVTAVFNGIGDMLSIQFDSQDHSDEQLQIWIREVCNQGHAESKQKFAEAMQGLTSELKLDGLPGMNGALASLTGG